MADPVRPTTSTLIHLGLHDLDKARVRLDRLARLVDDQNLAQTLSKPWDRPAIRTKPLRG